MLDADGQHPPEEIPALLEMLEKYHMVVGARTTDSETSFHRNLANRIYNRFASYVCGRPIDDLTSGFRAIRAGAAKEFVTLLPNTFSYPSTITLATVRSGYSLAYFPIKSPKRAAGSKSKIKLLRDGSRFFLIIFKITTLFSPMKIFLPASIFTFLAGVGYGLYKIFMLDGRYGPDLSNAHRILCADFSHRAGIRTDYPIAIRPQHPVCRGETKEVCRPPKGRSNQWI